VPSEHSAQVRKNLIAGLLLNVLILGLAIV
jgi:hypothetical protein